MKSDPPLRKTFLDAASLEAIDRVIETVHRLRAPGGCPWDIKQTHHSLRPFLIEENYKVLEVLDQIDSPEKLKKPEIRDALKEEFGDLLMQIALHSEMADQVGAFNFGDVARTLDEKLIRRHPHVFGETTVKDADEVLKNWDTIKAGEKAGKTASTDEPYVLDGVPKNLPALMRAEKTISKVTKAGFQWPDLEGPLGKLEEEIAELTAAVRAGKQGAIEEELGDLLFSVCNVAFMAKVKPEDALRGFLEKFGRRFRFIEESLRTDGKKIEETPLTEMDHYWNLAKKKERGEK
jgi:tetrapyrrole methylase family protein / MazG family protein